MSLTFHLECSIPCGAGPFAAAERHHLCTCGRPLLARYDWERIGAHWTRESLGNATRSMWRYAPALPLTDGAPPVTLGEGWTPLFPAPRLGAELGLSHLYVKDEALNPTNSFKARGMSAAVTRARDLGATTLAVPSAGNAACALAAYAANAGLEAQVFMPRDVKSPFIQECRLHGADVTLVDGLITDAGRLAAEQGRPQGWYDVSTLKEPYRVEGKKTMGYEIAEQLGWRWPDWIIYPTGGGTGIVGIWKACDELEQLGWVRGPRPRLVSVQADGCAPIVRAFQTGAETAEPWVGAATVADGLRVPAAVGDILVLRALRASGGSALAVSDTEMIQGMRDLGSQEGIGAAPEGGATLAALRRLVADGTISSHDRVVLLNTGGALKYLDVLE
ncbi:MAG: threonine synthase [Acidobacteria bacterium]|nr:threonine synthase [Acidobacteriota bacterium]MDP7479807.1 threonine synthase [Vicinamibacterales bacterium]MDP7693223.1 threonine synthase [Vicinamibacterales bacterium]